MTGLDERQRNSGGDRGDGPGDVSGFALNVATIAEAVDLAIARAARGKGFTFHTLNLDHVAKLRRSAAFRAAYRRATFICADGWPIVWFANRAAGRRMYQRAPGADMVEPLLKAAGRTRPVRSI